MTMQRRMRGKASSLDALRSTGYRRHAMQRPILAGVPEEDVRRVLQPTRRRVFAPRARALAIRVRRLPDMLVEASYVPAERRVLRRLTELAGDPGVVSLTQEELAQMAGTSRATVNRVLREARERGDLELRHGSVARTRHRKCQARDT
jgi:CRP-like cAMP-binding protein